jgi:hypothetical protein
MAETLGTNRAGLAAPVAWTAPLVRTRRTLSSAMTLPPARWTERGVARPRLTEHAPGARWTAPRQTARGAPPQRFQTRAGVDQPQIDNAFAGPPRILARAGASNPAPPVQIDADPRALGRMSARYWEDPASSRPPIPTAGPTIEHVTDQVLRTLDQRLVAARERLSKR